MNQIKSIYMMLLPMMLMAIIGFSVYMLFTYPINYAWLTTILTALPLLMFLIETMVMKSKPRTADFLPMHTMVASMGLVLSLIFFSFPNLHQSIQANHFALVLSELSMVLHVAYVFWYSSLQRPVQHFLVKGEFLPSFAVYKDNREILSESFLGFSTIIIFYRGNWCPFCMAQIKELAQQYRQLVLSGIKIVLISPQPEKITENLAKRFNVPFIFLTDKDNTVATQLGLNHKNGLPKGMELMGYSSDTIYPTVVVTNRKGRIIYLDETPSFRNRPEPKEYLNILLKDVV